MAQKHFISGNYCGISTENFGVLSYFFFPNTYMMYFSVRTIPYAILSFLVFLNAKYLLLCLFSNSLPSNENNPIYFRKQMGNKRKRKFPVSGTLFLESRSRVTCCVEIKLQYFFRKYIFICTIYTLLMQLISAILHDTC